jgi:hypothetical protein
MFALLKAKLGSTFRTKVGIALIGALVLGGGGTAMAMATSHGQPLAALGASGTSASPTAHADDSADATKVAGKGDQDDQACTGSANATATPSGAAASPTAHSGDGSDDRSGTPSATKAASQDDQEGNENENAQEEQNETECHDGSTSPKATRTPEPTETSEGAHTPGPTPTGGPGGD